MLRTDFRFFHRLRVRWVEVDMQKIVFNGHYLTYCDTAISDYWRATAVPYEEAMAALGGDLYVRKATLEYRASARFDDRLDVGIRCERVGTTSMCFTVAIFRADALLVTGELVYVFADPVSQTSRPVPAALRDVLSRFEAGEAMVEVKTGDWTDLGAQASSVRTAVFVMEQGIPMKVERDSGDAAAVHGVARNGLGQAVAAGRLTAHAPGVGKIGRMAVNKALRGSGIGEALLKALVAAAQTRGDHQVMLHAQASAAGFYERLGFAPRGELFEEAGTAHLEMFKVITPSARAVSDFSD